MFCIILFGMSLRTLAHDPSSSIALKRESMSWWGPTVVTSPHRSCITVKNVDFPEAVGPTKKSALW